MARKYDYDIDSVSGIDKLRERMSNAETVEDWSFILSDYIQSGNNKVSKYTAIFNMNSATDCPNFGTVESGESETGLCQVPKDSCYAYKAEKMYPQSLPYRRRQEYLWDCMTAEMWAKAFECLNSRKRNKFDSIRFSEAGDFRSDADIIRVNRIAELVSVPIYTYSASHKLHWKLAENFTVNASNNMADYGDRRFIALDKDAELPEGAVWCAFDYAEQQGANKDERPKCGDCRLCIDKEGPDVAIPIH